MHDLLIYSERRKSHLNTPLHKRLASLFLSGTCTPYEGRMCEFTPKPFQNPFILTWSPYMSLCLILV
jgi:hypothetical protein